MVADVVLVVDSSGSIRDSNPANNLIDNWNLVLMFLENIVNHMIIGDNNVRVGIVDYSDQARNIHYLNTYRDAASIRNSIYSMPYLDSTTNTSGAIRTARLEQFLASRGDRPDAMVGLE